jgi:UDP-N-acetylmuramoylalanine--D-glutamate ligase
MRIAIVGYGSQGKAAVDYWQRGNDITICDANETIDLPPGVSGQLGENYLQNLESFNLIIRSPAVHPRDLVAANSAHILKKVTTVTEEFFRVCPKPIIGVTGTKGKGTTSTLITKILEAAGKKVLLGGNIGTPPLDLLKQDIESADWVVLELANFQLIDLHVSPKIAVCLMVVPEHLDWHTSMDEYVAAKQNLFRYQDDDDRTVYNRLSDYSTVVAGVSPALKLSYEVPPVNKEPTERNGAYVVGDKIYMDDEEVCSVGDVHLPGRHNLENVGAAIAAVWDVIDGNKSAIVAALHSFTGLLHRLEFVRELDQVKYYDDSFGTTPETAIVAIQAFSQPKVIILGGSDKKASFDELAVKVKQSTIRSVVLIGDTAPQLRAALEAAGFTAVVDGGHTMQSIVATARQQARPGDIVLLSTGCASFGLFKNYHDRGEQFKSAVQALT